VASAGFWLSVPWSSQPQREVRASSNGLGSSLVHLWANMVLGTGGPGSVSVYDAAGSANGTFGVGSPSTLTGCYWKPGPEGNELFVSSSGTGSLNSVKLAVGDSTGTGSPGGSIFSIVARVVMNNISGNYQAIYSSGVGSIEFRVNADGTLSLLKAQIAGIGSSSGSLSNGVAADVGVSYDGTTYYINGVASGSSSNAQTFTNSQQYYLCSDGIPTDYFVASTLRRIAVFNQCLPAAAFSRLAGGGFWGLFEDEQIWVPVAAASGLPTLTSLVASNITPGGATLTVN
jgi:hypothetical protein